METGEVARRLDDANTREGKERESEEVSQIGVSRQTRRKGDEG
jgi:hypothetical protein